MNAKHINRALIGFGVFGTAASGVAAAICTYKAYPQLKEAKDNGASFKEMAGIVAKNYIPAFGAVTGTGVALVASEVLGEKKISELELKVKKLYSKYEKVSKWYKDEHQAVNETLTEKQKKLLEAKLKEKELQTYDRTDATKYCMFRDPFTGIIFESTEQQFIQAVNETINKNLVVNEYATYEDLCDYLAIDCPDEYKDFGWSVASASAQWVTPWLDISFTELKNEDGKTIKEINYIADAGAGKMAAFDAVEDPSGEGWR